MDGLLDTDTRSEIILLPQSHLYLLIASSSHETSRWLATLCSGRGMHPVRASSCCALLLLFSNSPTLSVSACAVISYLYMQIDLPAQCFVQYIPLIQNYLLAENKQHFIDSLPKGSTDSIFLQFCTRRNSWSQHQELLGRLGLSQQNKTKLQKLQALTVLLNEQSSGDREKAIEVMKRELNLSFEHTKPTATVSYDDEDSANTKLPQELRPEDYSLAKYFQKNSHEGACTNLTKYGIERMDKNKILHLGQKDLDAALGKLNLASQGDKALQILRQYLGVKRKRNKNFVIPQDLISRLTAAQLERLPKYLNEIGNPLDYVFWRYKKSIGYQINTEFPEKNNRLYSNAKLHAKKELLKKAISWLEDFKYESTQSFIDQLTIELLTVNILLEEPDLDILMEYLRRPRSIIPLFSEDYRRTINSTRQNYSYHTSWYNAHQFDYNAWPNDIKLIQDYLGVYFKHNPDPRNASQFQKYLDRDFLYKLCYRIKLQRGQSTPDLHAVFTKEEQMELKNKKQLTISDKNRRQFRTDQGISLVLLVKNIQQITAQIYEISTEKHFLSSTSQIDNTIALEFLEPLKKVTRSIPNDNPFEVRVVDFSLTEHLEPKNSIYIIDFQGEGILSRAVIRRGSIVCISRPTLAGIELKFFQQDGTVIDELDVWLRNRKVHIKEKYTIPYGQSTQTLNIVALKDGYAELVKVVVNEQSYNWRVSYTYHEENFLVGSKAKVLLNAQLSSNAGVISTQALKDTTITVNITNHLGIPSSLSFKGIKWDYKNEYELQIPIQTYLKQINIGVTAKVDKYVGEPQQLTSNRTIQFREEESSSLSFAEFFLSSTTEGYILKLLGKNGEPKPFISLSLDIYSKLFETPLNQTLMTNKNGQVKLGMLEDVKRINVLNASRSQIQTSSAGWCLDFAPNEVFYHSRMAVNEGEQLSLPVHKNFKIEDQVTLLKFDESNHNNVISDETHRLKFDGNLLRASLPKGYYLLQLYAVGRKITIEVAKLSPWGASKQFIDRDTRTIYQLPPHSQDPVCLSNNLTKIDQGDSQKISLKLQVRDKLNLEGVRVHILAGAFIYRNDYSKEVCNTIQQEAEAVRFKLNQNVCAYMNGKELSDEHCYILNRQLEEKFIGNNLQRPRVLLKRTFNRDTTIKKEQLSKQTDFKSPNRGGSKKSDKKSKQKSRDKGEDGEYAMPSFKSNAQSEEITLFNNFLKHPSLIIPNLHGQTIEFSLPKVYQSFVVIVASPSFVFQKLFSLDPIPLQTNNLISTGLKDTSPNHAFTISRECYRLQKGQTIKVKRSSEWTSVSGMTLSTLSEIYSCQLQDWVMGWPSYSYEKKLRVYDERACHELNTYIKYKDRQFFEKVVKPFILNKLEKGVVDYCLLEDQEAGKYAEIEYSDKLNAFQKCLVVEHLVKNKQMQKAKSIANAMILAHKALQQPYSEFQRRFDTIMTSKYVEAEYACAEGEEAQQGEDEEEEQDHSSIGCGGGGDFPEMSKLEEHRCTMKSLRESSADFGDVKEQLQQRKQFKAGFKQVEKTSEYVETTYYEMTNPEDSAEHITLSKFWVSLAEYFLNPQGQLLSSSIMDLSQKQDLTLAAAFLPLPFAALYSIKVDGQFVAITAESPFMVFVKEIKSMQFNSKYGVLISQRLSDPSDEYAYEEDGTKLAKSVQQFIKDKPYYLQTLVTNTSNSNLDLQILMDIPEGSIRLGSNQYTQVTSQTIGPYNTSPFKMGFYFPNSGTYSVYPANASKSRQVISKAAPLQKIVVKNQRTIKKLETLNDVLESGSKADILEFLSTKNIFDRKTLEQQSILWLLMEKDMFDQIIRILKNRSYYSHQIWEFGFLHKDLRVIKQYIEAGSLHLTPLYQRVFQYYPLTSHRVHKFMKEEKSTILNQTFKQTYDKLLIHSMLSRKTDNLLFLTVFTYYLILQDRVKQANELFKSISKLQQQKNFPRLQYDYLACFLDMYTGYPNFATAREISSKYIEYPVIAWQKLFKEVDSLLNTHDNTVYQEEKVKSHDIRLTIKGNKLSVLLPEKTTVEVNFHSVNLELMFSNSPFEEVKLFSTVKPFKTVIVTSEKGGQQFVNRPEGYANIYVHAVEIATNKQGQVFSPFFWTNESVKAKILQDEGVAVVFVDGKPRPGAYCKVYARGKQTRFYKDGYTDIQGRFKYVSQLEDVEKFSILLVTERGGLITSARPPTTGGTLD